MPKTEQEKAAIRAEVEARRRPEKDRTAHENAREKKVEASLNLSRHNPDRAELTRSLYEMYHGTDRVAAILGSNLVENELRELFLAYLPDLDDADANALLHDQGAPLGSFYDRTLMGKALQLFAPSVAEKMHVIRRVRNDFAHTLLSIDFETPAIVSRCEKLPDLLSTTASELGEKMREDMAPARHRFERACWDCTLVLLKKQTDIYAERANHIPLARLVKAGIDAHRAQRGDDDGAN